MPASSSKIGSVELGDRPVKMCLAHDEELGLVVIETVDDRFADAAPAIALSVDRSMLTKHPSVARVHGVERAREGLLVTSEYIEGESFADLVRDSNNALPLTIRLRVVLDVITALSSLHADGVALGTLSASSIIVGSDDGVARITGAHRSPLGARGMSASERRVAPPEIALGHVATPASDVYAIGVMLWESLARKPLADVLVEGSDAPAPTCAQRWAEPLCELAQRALSIDPAARPSTVAEIAASIRMVARTKLASREAVLGAVAEFAMEHILARRARFARSSGEIQIAPYPTSFEASTSPRGRTIAEDTKANHFEPEAPTTPRGDFKPTPLSHEVPIAAELKEVAEIEALTEQRLEPITGAHEAQAPRAALASTGGHAPPIVRRSLRAPIAAAVAAMVAVLLFMVVSTKRHEVAREAPPLPPSATETPLPAASPPPPVMDTMTPRESASKNDSAPAPSASAPSTSASTTRPAIPSAPAKPPRPRTKPSLRSPGQYDPASI